MSNECFDNFQNTTTRRDVPKKTRMYFDNELIWQSPHQMSESLSDRGRTPEK